MKLKAKERREMEEAEERARKQNDEYGRASAGEKNAATLVRNERTEQKVARDQGLDAWSFILI